MSDKFDVKYMYLYNKNINRVTHRITVGPSRPFGLRMYHFYPIKSFARLTRPFRPLVPISTPEIHDLTKYPVCLDTITEW